MPYITREDGERFVIPSYRDVLIAKQATQLKKEVLLLSQNYGDYITLQKKGTDQYEVAFSTDTGYLLGESVWHHFKRPQDMIYCEAIPNTTEVILVIVKSGSVYLDGSFSQESIPEELVIFLTQANNFEIYVYGDVPISQTPEEGKFSFEANSVKSFNVLETPVFPTLPLLKIYQLQLVEAVLKSQGIGVLPIRKIVLTLLTMGVIFAVYTYMTQEKAQEFVESRIGINPLQPYIIALKSPEPSEMINAFLDKFNLFLTIPGWTPTDFKYAADNLTVGIKSLGGRVEDLNDWAKKNNATLDITQSGIDLKMPLNVDDRPSPKNIYPLKEVIAKFLDDLENVYPGNHIRINEIADKGPYDEVEMAIRLEGGVSPATLALIGKQMRSLPIVVETIDVRIDEQNSLNGSLTIQALGS